VIFLEEGRAIKKGRPDEVFSEKRLSSKIQLTGVIISIQPAGVIYIIEMLAGNSVIKVIATKEEVEELHVGDQVMIFSKAFNPIIRKL
jgi:molybdate transport system ATP-binding protein